MNALKYVKLLIEIDNNKKNNWMIPMTINFSMWKVQ